MMKELKKIVRGYKGCAKAFLLVFLLMFAGTFAACGKSGTDQEADLSKADILEDMKEEVLTEDQIAAAFEDELYPLEGEALEMMENSTGDPKLEDDEMVPLDEAALDQTDTSGENGETDPSGDEPSSGEIQVEEDGTYTSKEEVAVYLHRYGHLPSNYITKSEAQKLGWKSSEGNLDEVAPGMSIGGDRFGNYEGMLPEEEGRTYRECDIDYDGGYRNDRRIIYSNDGLIFYTGDHYETFEQLY